MIESKKPKVTSLIDKKYDWYQSATHCFITFKILSPFEVSALSIVFEPEAFKILYCSDLLIELRLSNEIDSEKSSKTITTKKIELKLQKVIENVNWASCEAGGEARH